VELPSPKIIRNNKYQFRFEVASFLIQNNLPFNLSDKLSAFISTLAQKFTSDELSIFTVDRNHISDIAGSCLGPFFQQSYLNLLKNTPFSLSLDEGSIKGNTEYLAVNARYLETSTSLHTTTKLIAMIQLEGSKTGETLYNLLVSLLFTGSDGEMRKKMCLGICTDGAANMISSGNSSLTSRLEEIFPQIISIHDFCHVFNLILKDCINEHFPEEYIKVVKNFCNKFANSPKQCSLLKQQIMKNQERTQHKMFGVKRYVETRWSSFQEALERIIEIKDDLQEFFNQSEIEKERNYLNTQSILMLELLLFLVKLINDYIIAFQKENWDMMETITTLKESIVMFSTFVYKHSLVNQREIKAQETFGDLDKDFEDLLSFLRPKSSNTHAKFVKRTKKEFGDFFLQKQHLFAEKIEKIEKVKIPETELKFNKLTTTEKIGDGILQEKNNRKSISERIIL